MSNRERHRTWELMAPRCTAVQTQGRIQVSLYSLPCKSISAALWHCFPTQNPHPGWMHCLGFFLHFNAQMPPSNKPEAGPQKPPQGSCH